MNIPPIPKIGIIGGAGPAAGSLLFDRMISICQKEYSCKADADFPAIQLLSVPFPDMLKPGHDRAAVQEALRVALQTLRSCCTTTFAVACNTLHGFIEPCMYSGMQFVSLMESGAKALSKAGCEDAIVLCTSTTASLRLQQPFFEAIYPSGRVQNLIDYTIDKILAGSFGEQDSERLVESIKPYLKDNRGVVLGCTEFSVLNEIAPFNLHCSMPVIDPIDEAAKILVQSTLKFRSLL